VRTPGVTEDGRQEERPDVWSSSTGAALRGARTAGGGAPSGLGRTGALTTGTTVSPEQAGTEADAESWLTLLLLAGAWVTLSTKRSAPSGSRSEVLSEARCVRTAAVAAACRSTVSVVGETMLLARARHAVQKASGTVVPPVWETTATIMGV
jgi:hypothetical protein